MGKEGKTTIIIIIINLVKEIHSKIKVLKHYHLRLSPLLKTPPGLTFEPTIIELRVEILCLRPLKRIGIEANVERHSERKEKDKDEMKERERK